MNLTNNIRNIYICPAHCQQFLLEYVGNIGIIIPKTATGLGAWAAACLIDRIRHSKQRSWYSVLTIGDAHFVTRFGNKKEGQTNTGASNKAYTNADPG